MMKDDADICSALIDWFESQEVKPPQAVLCLAQLLGVMLGDISPTIGECVKGTMLCHETIIMTALNVLSVKLKKE